MIIVIEIMIIICSACAMMSAAYIDGSDTDTERLGVIGRSNQRESLWMMILMTMIYLERMMFWGLASTRMGGEFLLAL